MCTIAMITCVTGRDFAGRRRFRSSAVQADIRGHLSESSRVNRIPERRSDETRAALLAAFVAIVFRDGFENVSVQRIVTDAGTARSTFYEHFSGKEDILCASMAPFFATFAQCVSSADAPAELDRVLDHMWDNRRLVDAIFCGTPRVILARSLGEMVEAQLRECYDGAALTLPYRLAAIQLAEAQLALVEAWLRGRAFASVGDLGTTLHRTSRASAAALRRAS